MLHISFEPFKLLAPEIAQATRFQVHDVYQADEMRARFVEAVPAVAALLLQFRKRRLWVFIFQDRPQWENIGSPTAAGQHASFWVESWSADGLRYFVVADTSAENVRQLSNLMKSAAGAE